jgi:hypothetical protein
MSKLTKNYGWLNTRPNSAKTLMERAKREIPGFKEHIRKFEEQINIKSYAPQAPPKIHVFPIANPAAGASVQHLPQ